jgi:cephalosporin-C deacetylase-like acetyl esterase
MISFTSSVNNYHAVNYQVITDLRRRAEEHSRRHQQEKAALTTTAEFEARRERVKANFLDAVGGLPAERTPLNARVTGTRERGNFTVENVIYESLPGFPVTAALYMPKGLDGNGAEGKAPAVIFVCGHSDDGKAHTTYQAVCIDLANNGFIVFAIDPVGQGERFQYLDEGLRLHGACTNEHTHGGLPFWLRGASIARHFVWDIVRGVDYLETRPEVDMTRIGITGNSGGGLQTCFAMMAEPRIAAAMPCTFVSTLEAIQKSGKAQDAEQIVPFAMSQGPDHDDFLTAIAPRPVRVGVVAYDFFPIEGSVEAVHRAKQIYKLYGKEENIDLAVANSLHQYAPGLREACVNWFKQHFKGEAPDFKTGTPELVSPKELWATKSGHVYLDFPDAVTILDLTREALPDAPNYESADAHREALAKTLGIAEVGERGAPIYPRILTNTHVNGYRAEPIFFNSARDIMVAGAMVHPRNSDSAERLDTTILLLGQGTNDSLEWRGRIESILRKGHRVFVFDARGVGAVTETASVPSREYENDSHSPEYKFGCDAMMLGVSLLGMRVFDVLRAHDYLRSREDVGAIHVHGVSSGAVFGFYASVLEPNFASLTCEDMLYSYRNLSTTRDYMRTIYNLKIMAYGLLNHGDFADYMPVLAPRPVTFIRPRNALGEVIDSATFEQEFSPKAAGGSKPTLASG